MVGAYQEADEKREPLGFFSVVSKSDSITKYAVSGDFRKQRICEKLNWWSIRDSNEPRSFSVLLASYQNTRRFVIFEQVARREFKQINVCFPIFSGQIADKI